MILLNNNLFMNYVQGELIPRIDGDKYPYGFYNRMNTMLSSALRSFRVAMTVLFDQVDRINKRLCPPR